MKKRLVLISLTLVLMLMALAPATALAAKPQPFCATGVITGIEATVIGDNVFPAGNSGRWRVVGREIGGELSGDVNGSFLMTYKANIESTETQAGNLHGTLDVGEYSFKVNGTIQPLEIVEIVWINPVTYYPILKLTINGRWNLADRGPGQGDFEAGVIFIPDIYGHVACIVASSFVMDGKW
jgi:hypothetical protein